MSESDVKQTRGIEVIRKLGIRPSGPPLHEGLATATVEHLFGDIWNRPGLPIEERSLVTCASLIVLGRESEQRIHFRGALNLGIPSAKLEEVITHLAHYGGWPVAVGAARVLAEVVEEWNAEKGSDS